MAASASTNEADRSSWRNCDLYRTILFCSDSAAFKLLKMKTEGRDPQTSSRVRVAAVEAWQSKSRKNDECNS